MSEQPGTDQPTVEAYDAWTLGRTRLVAFKAERLLAEAQRELGAFSEPLMSTRAGPELLRISEHVTEALEALARLQADLRDVSSA